MKIDDIVLYAGCSKEQINWGNNDTPYMLIIGEKYTISNVVVHKQHTKVQIKGVDETLWFNSVCFTE
jgi:hypothetical protein